MENTMQSYGVASSPHLTGAGLSTRDMMKHVLIGLLPIIVFAGFRFGLAAWLRLALGAVFCVGLEAVFMGLRKRASAVWDASALLTGLIFVLSLPPTVPLFVIAVGSLACMGLGKAIFGGLGQNIFNPAMVGRAFVTAAFPAQLSAGACIPDGLSGATPLTQIKMGGMGVSLDSLFLGQCTGSMGEVCALAALLGGIYMLVRGAASWQIPLSILATSLFFAMFRWGVHPVIDWGWAHELTAGGLMFGAFFIATDPVSSPVSHRGRLMFGTGVAVLTWFFRAFSGYPEGFMFSILLMNAVSPLINQLQVSKPVGGYA